MATGALDANGIWLYGEDDSEPTASALLNKLGNSVSDKFDGGLPVANGGTGATTVAGAQDSLRVGLVPISPTSVEKAGASSTATANALGLVTFSACTSLSLNGVFSSSYSKYLVYLSGVGGSVAADIFFRFRTSGGADSSTGYYQQQASVNGGTLSGTNDNNIAAGNIGIVGSGGTSASSAFVIHNPASAITTNYTGQLYGVPSAQIAKSIYGFHNVDTAYTGITIYLISGGLSGTVQIIGINQ